MGGRVTRTVPTVPDLLSQGDIRERGEQGSIRVIKKGRVQTKGKGFWGSTEVVFHRGFKYIEMDFRGIHTLSIPFLDLLRLNNHPLLYNIL